MRDPASRFQEASPQAEGWWARSLSHQRSRPERRPPTLASAVDEEAALRNAYGSANLLGLPYATAKQVAFRFRAQTGYRAAERVRVAGSPASPSINTSRSHGSTIVLSVASA